MRAILQHGPSKIVRIPFLVGPSNSGKSTLLYPFDDVFGPKYVLHKPALGSSFALRNITKKRFIFWDDYSPVEYAQEKTITKSLFLSLFIGQNVEVQCSQSFSDGNMDVKWNRGVAFTAKSRGLWNATAKISEEDVTHMRNRCEEFRFEHTFDRKELKDVPSCAHHLAKWVLEGASEHDAASLVGRSLPQLACATSDFQRAAAPDAIDGFKHLMEVARIPHPEQHALATDLEELGAADVAELMQSDWESLASWSRLKPLQQRRLLQHVIGPQRD